MSQILSEVLASNRAYAANFGDKGKLGLPPARRSQYSPAWMPGSIPPNVPAWPKGTRT
jgi:hypothetical protein